MLGYELLSSYPKMNRLKTEQMRLDRLEQFIAEMIQGMENLASPPYTDEEKAQLKSEFRKKWNPKRHEQASIVNSLPEKHREFSFLIGWLGLVFLLAGFALQIGGVLVK